MLININDALDRAEPVDLILDGASIIGFALQGRSQGHGEIVPDTLEFSFSAPVEVHLDLSSTGRDVIINGAVKTGLTLQCSRCLKDFLFAVDSGFMYFAPLAEEPEEKQGKAAKRKFGKKAVALPDEESVLERELSHVEGGELNLTALLLEEITSKLPTKPLCKESCKGLCLSCGTDLNLAKCKCAVNVKIDSRLKKLKEFKIK